MTSFEFFVVEPQGGTKVLSVHCRDITISRHSAFLLACVLTTAWLNADTDTFGEEITFDNLRHLKEQQQHVHCTIGHQTVRPQLKPLEQPPPPMTKNVVLARHVGGLSQRQMDVVHEATGGYVRWSLGKARVEEATLPQLIEACVITSC